MKHLIFSLLVVLGLSVNSWAQFVAGTGFEDLGGVNARYIDGTPEHLTDHALDNHGGGQPIVDFTDVGGEIGFGSFFTETGNTAGLRDAGTGDFIGVSTADARTGSNSFRFSDPDGILTLTPDAIDISGEGAVRLTFWYLIKNATFESTDRFFANITVDGGTPTSLIDVQNSGGTDIEALADDTWRQIISPIISASANSVVLDFNVQFNSVSETLFLDDIEVNAIPEPATYALILGGLAIGVVIWKRRRS